MKTEGGFAIVRPEQFHFCAHGLEQAGPVEAVIRKLMASSEHERGEQELGSGHMGEVKTKPYGFTDEHSSQQILRFHSDVMWLKPPVNTRYYQPRE